MFSELLDLRIRRLMRVRYGPWRLEDLPPVSLSQLAPPDCCEINPPISLSFPHCDQGGIKELEIDPRLQKLVRDEQTVRDRLRDMRKRDLSER